MTHKQRVDLGALLRQSSRYLIVGFSSAAIELALFVALADFMGIFIMLANSIALALATLYNFIMSRKWTFNSTSSLSRSIVLYLILFAWNQVFSYYALGLLLDFDVHALLAKVMTMACIVSWNFVLYRKVVFK